MKNNIHSSARLIATKYGRVVLYDEQDSPMMPLDPLITWSREIDWQINSLISPIPQSLWPPNLTGQ